MMSDEILFAFNAGLALQALEHAYDNAATVREAHDHSVLRFDDLSEVKIYINNEHEITIM